MRTPDGGDLILKRTLRAPIDDVWASVTESERTARWFGPWQGHGAPGATVNVQLAYKEGTRCDLHIDACEPPRHLAVSMSDEAGHWRLELHLSEVDDGTELRLVQRLDSAEGIGEIGPGWEYYLDMLLASREGATPPRFDDYYPALKEHFEELARR